MSDRTTSTSGGEQPKWRANWNLMERFDDVERHE